MKRYTYFWLGIALFIASLNLRPAINSISPLIESIQNDLAMSASTASLLTSIPVLCMGIFSPLAAGLANRFGIERVIGWSLVIIGIGTVLRIFTNTTAFLLLTAFIAGVGIAAVGPLLSGFIKKYFPNRSVGMIAVYTVALAVGAGLSSGAAAPLQHAAGSWQFALAFWAVIAIAAVIMWTVIVLPIVKVQKKEKHFAVSSKLPWHKPEAWLLTFSFGLMAFIFYSLTAWIPPIIQDMGYSKVYAANLLVLFTIMQIPANLSLPLLLNKIPSRLFWLLIASALEFIGFSMIILAIVPWLAACIIGLGAGTLFALNLMLPIDVTNEPQEAASLSAMVQGVGYVIGAAGPFIIGAVHDITGNFSSSVIVLISVVVLMAVVQIIAVTKNNQNMLVSDS